MASSVWTLTRPQDLLWRDWGDYGVAYDAGSGSTHVLSALAIELLVLLHHMPRDEAALTQELADALPDDAASATALITMQLATLQQLGLATPGPDSA